MEYIASQKRLKHLLDEHGFNIKKNFGQNFLIDQNILKKIVHTAGVTQNTNVLEIGPGVGSLTQMLATYANHVYCFEVDYKLEPLLSQTLSDFTNTEIIFNDFLKIDLNEWYQQIDKTIPLKIVANLPYYITTPIMEKIINWYVTCEPNLESATVMMQKEVANRLVAKPSTKEYGSLSIFMQLFADVKTAFTVPKTVFIPAPNIDSAIVHFTFKKSKLVQNYQDAENLMAFIRMCFVTRRKTLVNNLKNKYNQIEIIQGLEAQGIDARVRAEQLTVHEFIELYNALENR